MSVEQDILRPGSATRPDASAPSAAWYPDPADSESMRWWDGAAWTDTVRQVRGNSDATDTAAADSGAGGFGHLSPFEELTGEEFAEPWVASPELDSDELSSADRLRLAAGYSPAASPSHSTPSRGGRLTRFMPEPHVEPRPEAVPSDDDSQNRYSPAQDSWRPPVAPDWKGASRRVTGSPNTTAGWLLATMTLWFGLILSLIHAVVPNSGERLATIVTVIVVAIVSFGLAWADASKLRSEGFESVASPLWVFLYQGVYFVLRAIRLGGQGLGMVITFFALQLLAVVMLIVSLAVLIPFILTLGDKPDGPVRVDISDVQPAPAAADALPLSAEARAEQLTPAGMVAVLREDFTKAGAPVAGARCEPFPATTTIEDATTTTCLAQVSGWYYDLTVRATPADPYHAFAVATLVPRS